MQTKSKGYITFSFTTEFECGRCYMMLYLCQYIYCRKIVIEEKKNAISISANSYKRKEECNLTISILKGIFPMSCSNILELYTFVPPEQDESFRRQANVAMKKKKTTEGAESKLTRFTSWCYFLLNRLYSSSVAVPMCFCYWGRCYNFRLTPQQTKSVQFTKLLDGLLVVWTFFKMLME